MVDGIPIIPFDAVTPRNHPTAMIRVQDLRIDYDDICAVDDVSVEIQAGEVYGLIGPNGAGKTSTIRALVGLLEPTYGEIEICGIDVREHPQEAAREIGFMPDFPPMYDDLLVWEFLDLFAGSYFIPKAKRPDVIEKYLDLVGLTRKYFRLVAELSRGMRQRLMLAKTLLPDPQVLLLDEPASGMDPNGRADLKRAIRRLADEGRTVLVSSHILSEMNEFCTSIGIMEMGRLVVSGRVDEIASKVMGAGVLEIEIIHGLDEFQQIVAESDRTENFEKDGRVFEVVFDGDNNDAAELLSQLVEAGVGVASFARRKDSLEDVFLQVGAQELS